MRGRYIYQLAATILPNGLGHETVVHDLGIFTSLRTAEKIMRMYVNDGNFYCPVYSYSIMFLPVNDDLEYQSERQINIYSPAGELQISEFNMISCNGAWSNRLNIDIRAIIDIGPFKKPYFVLYNHWRRGLATKCARISFLEPKYELGASYNKSVWFLDENEKKMLVRFLKAGKHSPHEAEPSNNWRLAIGAFNNEVRGEDDSRILPYDLPIPDYTKLEP